MGTHPIFESDFDCLADMNLKTLFAFVTIVVGSYVKNFPVSRNLWPSFTERSPIRTVTRDQSSDFSASVDMQNKMNDWTKYMLLKDAFSQIQNYVLMKKKR